MTGTVVTLIALFVVLAAMLLELRHSRGHERWLREAGAISPPDPVYPIMRVAYPGVFIGMAIEGMLRSRPPDAWTAAGGVIFIAAKALKYWAIGTLGTRWTYRVLVLPGAPLIDTGPYRYLRHPNYAAVLGEMIGVALASSAPVAGLTGTLLFATLLQRRIASENAAHARARPVQLGRDP